MKRRQFLATAAGSALAGLYAPALHAYDIPEALAPVDVRLRGSYTPGEIIVAVPDRLLYHITAPKRARRYVVAVGKEGLNFQGNAVIARKVEWPSWRPTAEMIERNPRYARYADGVPGGPDNPLGARALYLYQNGRDTAFRIHGTTEPRSIGHPVSNGCIRMFNEHVIELYDRIPLGTPVRVL